MCRKEIKRLSNFIEPSKGLIETFEEDVTRRINVPSDFLENHFLRRKSHIRVSQRIHTHTHTHTHTHMMQDRISCGTKSHTERIHFKTRFGTSERRGTQDQEKRVAEERRRGREKGEKNETKSHGITSNELLETTLRLTSYN